MYNNSGFSFDPTQKELFVERTLLEQYMLLSGRRQFVGHALASTVFELAQLGIVQITHHAESLTLQLVHVPCDMSASLAETLRTLFDDPHDPAPTLVLDGSPLQHMTDQLASSSRDRLTKGGLLRKYLDLPWSVVVMFKLIFAAIQGAVLFVASTTSAISAIMALLVGVVSYMVLFTFWLDREHLPLTHDGKHERDRHLRLLTRDGPAFHWRQLVPGQLRKPPSNKPDWWTGEWPASYKDRAKLVDQAFSLAVKSFSSWTPKRVRIAA
ncbi:MAG TPA: hypothetical protein VFO38_06490 [Candidatus Saccharimonadales bacterium]|nr:hypothetical protein [Candidatus Saccharimonadales bacterium]